MTFGAIETSSHVFNVTSIGRFHLTDINLNKIINLSFEALNFEN